jgi:hypothetical protein
LGGRINRMNGAGLLHRECNMGGARVDDPRCSDMPTHQGKTWAGANDLLCFASIPGSVACLGGAKATRLAHSRSFQLAIPPVCCLPGRFSRTVPAEAMTCTADD